MPRAENVEITQADAVQAHRAGVDADIMFAGQLARGVGAERGWKHRLVLGKLDRVAVGAAGCGEHEPPGFRPPRSLEHVERGRRPARVRFERFTDGTGHAGNRPLVKDMIDTLSRVQTKGEVGEIALEPFVAPLQMIQVGSVTRGQVIGHAYPVPLVHQGLDKMRADEPGSPRDQYQFGFAHKFLPLVMTIVGKRKGIRRDLGCRR